MNDLNRQNGKENDGKRSWFVVRVAVASGLVLAVGLFGMYGYYHLMGEKIVGLDTLDPDVPILPSQKDESNQVRLFFTANGALLAPELREIESTDSLHERARAVVDMLLEGPRSKQLRSPVPRRTSVRALYIVGDMAVLDMTQNLQVGMAGQVSAEMLCVYSLVNTICLNCPGVRKVRILIEGRPVETLGGGLDLTSALVENLTLIEPARNEADSGT